MDFSLYRASQILNKGCTAAVGALHDAKVAWALCVCGIVPHKLMARGNPANTWSALIRGNITCTTQQLLSPPREHTGFPVNARKWG